MELEVLEITRDIILQYTFAPVKTHMKLSWLWNNVWSRSNNTLTKALEIKMQYKEEFPVRVEIIVKEFRAWHTYITSKLHEEENYLSI